MVPSDRTPSAQSTTGRPGDSGRDLASAAAITALLARARALHPDRADPSAAPGVPAELVAQRLSRSVLRPLQHAAEQVAAPTAEPTAAPTAAQAGAGESDPPAPNGQAEPAGPPSPGRHSPDSGDLDAALWELARDATRLRATVIGPAGVLEAVAGLQDLTLALAGDDARRAQRHEVLAELQAQAPAAIEVVRDGPYLVTNPRRVEDHLGCAVMTAPQIALCRCGQSKRKPLCDGTHADVGFTDAKDPARVPDRRDTYVGQQVTILDNRGICQHSGLCTDRLATVFRVGEEPFVAPSGGRMDEIIRAVRDCPSGALSYAVDGIEARADVDRHGTREPTIQVTRDGPYRVTGGIGLVGEDGAAVRRNEGSSDEHYALCRCGRSQNKPFCSGMHWYVEFHDPVPDPQATPTIFEWAGGLPALTRMTRLFYEKFVPQDPLLAPLFANMSADHPERVAKWLGEVFGGPALYSDAYGGYPRMLSQHVGKRLTEDWRRRWVELLLQSAREAGLPNDPEFRAAFQSYIEWGSRLAVENSQSDAHPPQHMPMPQWDWHTAAGPPGSRISALTGTDDPPEEPVVLPADDEPVQFDKHIRRLFRDRDRRSMSFAFDLGDLDDVRRHAPDILGRVRDGTMPCDGTWPTAWIDAFARWVETGMAP